MWGMDKDTLKAWRKDHGWSQSKAANELGVSLRGYCYWEAGERVPPGRLLELACDHLNILALDRQ